jgi:phosphoribosylanthranilate isomerase
LTADRGVPIEAAPAAKVKVCGITTVADARMVAKAGVNWIGLNFHPGSPRYLEPSRAAQIVATLPSSVAPVGLFVDRPPLVVAAIARQVGITIVQLHGQEPPEDLLELATLRVVRAFRLADAAAVVAMSEYLRRADALGRAPDAILIDAHDPDVRGGTGRLIASELLDGVPAHARLILAGGLTPENVAEQVARVRPWMVDVASGVESAPGRKDPARVAAFVRAAHGAAH